MALSVFIMTDSPVTTKIKSIVYVDDDQDMLSLVQVVLEQVTGVEVKTFTSPTKALADIRLNTPDMVILDYHMPQMRGTEIMQKIQHMGLNVPITFFTAQSSPEEIKKIKALGANKVIVKPIDIDELNVQLFSL